MDIFEISPSVKYLSVICLSFKLWMAEYFAFSDKGYHVTASTDASMTASGEQNLPHVTTPDRMAQLDGLRAVAILLVVIFHTWFFLQDILQQHAVFRDISENLPWILAFIRRGDLGVDIFFVLSGFLLSWQLFNERLKTGRLRVRRFYLTRIFRIYPLYILALLIAAGGLGLSWKFLGNLFAYNIWLGALDIVLPWTWSLSVELEFYAIVPLLIILFRSGPTTTFFTVAACVMSVVWVYWAVTAFPQIIENSYSDFKIARNNNDLDLFFRLLYTAMPMRLAQFFLGMAGAWVVVHRPDILAGIGRRTLAFLMVVIVVGACFPLLANPFDVRADANPTIVYIEALFGRVGFATAVALVIVLMQADHLPRTKRFLSSRLLEPVARFSFSMYLFHPVFIVIGIVIFIGIEKVITVSVWQYIGVLIVTIIGSMLFGYATWRWIEAPIIRYGRRLNARLDGKISKPVSVG